MELEAGGTANLLLDIEIRQRHGPQRFTCFIGEEKGGEWPVAIETIVYHRVEFEDFGPLHFGAVDPSSKEARTIDLNFHGQSFAELPVATSVKLESDSELVSVESGASQDRILHDGICRRTISVVVRLCGPTAPGLTQSVLTATVTLPDGIKTLRKGIDWSVRNLTTVTPAQVYFGQVDPSTAGELERHVVIRRVDGKPISVKSAVASDPAVRCRVEAGGDGATVRIVLALTSEKLSDSLWTHLVVETDYSAQPILRIPVAAVVCR